MILLAGFSYAQAAAAQGVAAAGAPAAAGEEGGGAFDLVFDSQCFHCLRVFDEGDAALSFLSLE